jgi:hypothetical protein
MISSAIEVTLTSVGYCVHHSGSDPHFSWMALPVKGVKCFHLAEFLYFYSSVAMILFRSLFNFASVGNSFSVEPISRLTVLRTPMSSRSATQSSGTFVSALTTSAIGAFRQFPVDGENKS